MAARQVEAELGVGHALVFGVGVGTGVGHWEGQRTHPVCYWYAEFLSQLSFRGGALGRTEDTPCLLLVCKVFMLDII